MRFLLRCMFAIVLVFTISTAAYADLIASANYAGGYGMSGGDDPPLEFLYIDYDFYYDATAKVFDSVTLDLFDIGSEFFTTSSTDPGFNAFVAYLTNNINETLWGGLTTNTGHGYSLGIPENAAFGTTDINGALIVQLGLKVNSLVFNHTDTSSNVDYDITLNAYGSKTSPVPEPTTMLLLGTGLIGLAGFRRKLKGR